MTEITITKKQFQAFEKVRASGVTNMFDVKVVKELSGLDKETIIAIMQHYSELMEKYPGVRN